MMQLAALVNLGIFVEQQLQLVLRYTYSRIRNRDPNPYFFTVNRQGFQLNQNFPGVGELQGVAYDIHDDLAYLGGIPRT